MKAFSSNFVRVGCCVPCTKVTDVSSNLSETIRLARKGDEGRATLLLFPELGLSAYAIDDLLFQDTLLAAVERAIVQLIDVSRDLYPVLIVGVPSLGW
jgi:NAD+ synthase (glutamine-hydrolysing)